MTASCPVCVKSVLDSDEGMGCGGACQRWFHRTCINMSKADYQRYCGNNTLHWYCSRTDCVDTANMSLTQLSSQMTSVLSKLDKLLGQAKKIDEISKDVSEIKTELSTIRDGLSDLEPRMDSVEERVVNIETQLKSSMNISSGDIEATIAEFNERLRRSKNIMIYNLAESASNDAGRRMSHDLDMIQKLLTPLHPTLAFDKLKAFRVGKKLAGKSRPLKVILSNVSEASNIVGKFSAEAAAEIDPSFSSVKMSRDRTPRETLHLRSLNSELNERISRGEKDLTIKYISNVPQIVKTPKN